MKMGTKIFTVVLAATALTACTGQRSDKVASLQKKDKFLSCQEVQLEMNEAEFYRRTAEKNKGPSMRNVMMPLGYISTYMSAEEAIGAADARVDYLNRIYEIMECDDPKKQKSRPVSAQAAPAAAAPMPVMMAPQQYVPMGYQPMAYGYQPMSYAVPAQPMPQYVTPQGENYNNKDWFAY